MKHLLHPLAIIRGRSEEARAPIVQCTWQPKAPEVVRLHLVPPRPGIHRRASLLYVNGQHIIPLNHGTAALLRTFMSELVACAEPGQEVTEEAMSAILDRTTTRMHSLFPSEPLDRFRADLGRIQDMIGRIARGEPVPELEGQGLTLAEYASSMRAPMRMDLAVMPMRIDNIWSCPLACSICYASKGPAMQVSADQMLTTQQWKQVLDRLWQIGVPQVSFTGGDPLAREDIVELVAHASDFITRLNTSAVLLTPELARELYEADLDVIQATVYSTDAGVHGRLVGREGSLARTLDGIRAAMAAGVQVSVNTPLVPENLAGYAETIGRLHDELGVRYFTASGMLPAGGAVKRIADGGAAPTDALFDSLRRAKEKADELGCEIDFTSPGCLSDSQLHELGMNVPSCGACLGNMAIGPDGEVLPCQSWVHEERPLGNILIEPWKRIWDHRACKRVRAKAALKNDCPLAGEVPA